MALLPILKYPDPRLRNQAELATQVDDNIRKITSDLLETMYEANCVGLAAIQVNIQKQIFVMDTSDDRSGAVCFINPEIISFEGKQKGTEGCASFPGVWEKIERAAIVTVKSLNEQGEAQEHKLEDALMSACAQHEIEHLQGKLFIDRLSPLRRHMILKKFNKQRRQTF